MELDMFDILENSISQLKKLIFRFNAPMDNILADFFKSNGNKFNQKERNFIADRIYLEVRNAPPPQWLLERLNKQFGNKDFVNDLLNSLKNPAPLDIRVNILKQNVTSVANELNRLGIDATQMEYSPYGLRIYERVNLLKTELYKNGVIEIQDESSQLATILLKPKRNSMVVDFCAGSGGKSLAIAMMMRNTGQIYAFDINQKRLDNIKPRILRANSNIIYPQLINDVNDIKVRRLYEKVDYVFVDAPCSGLGTLRRSPDLKFRHNEGTIKNLRDKQLEILQASSKLLKVGGEMIYATCSILNCENQDIVSEFLARNSDFQLVPIKNRLSIKNLQLLDEKYMILLPNLHNTDGFFAAILQRI